MSESEARARLQKALEKVSARIEAAEARPSREEIEAIKQQRMEDLEEIEKLRNEIKKIIK